MVRPTTPSILYALSSCVLKIIHLYPWSFYEIPSVLVWMAPHLSLEAKCVPFGTISNRTSFVRVISKEDGHPSF